jgi:hypothetical protein
MTTRYTTQPGGFYGVRVGNEAAVNPPAARFDPSQLNVQPRPGYMDMPGYNPFLHEQNRDRFILHNPRSGVAGNPFGPDFQIPGGQPWNKAPLLPGNDTKKFEERPFTVPFTLPSATNVPLAMNVGNVGGMITQVDPRVAALGSLMQAGGLPPGYVRRTIS